MCESRGWNVVIVSEDSDFKQLVSPQVSQYLPRQEVLLTNENFEQVTGMNQAQLLLSKCIIGDASDGIKGVPGVGAKTAIQAFAMFKTATWSLSRLDKFLALCRKEKAARIKRIGESKRIINRNLKLISLDLEVIRQEFSASDMERIVHACEDSLPLRQNDVVRTFERLGFNSLLKSLGGFMEPFRALR